LLHAQLVHQQVARPHQSGRHAALPTGVLRRMGTDAGVAHRAVRQTLVDDDLPGEKRLERIGRVEPGDLPGDLLAARAMPFGWGVREQRGQSGQEVGECLRGEVVDWGGGLGGVGVGFGDAHGGAPGGCVVVVWIDILTE
jgi:hypothetical protein